MTDTRTQVDPLTPVLVGIGVAGHEVADGGQLTPLDLMEEALRSCLTDTATTNMKSLLTQIAMVSVTEGNWSYGDPGAELARRVGITDARSVRVDVGVPQHTPIAAALSAIRAGTMRAAVIVGGEAKATQIAMQRGGGVPFGTADSEPELVAMEPAERWQPSGEILAQPEIDAGMWSAVEHYACIEAALRHAEGRTVDEQLGVVAELWHRFNVVARDNPLAAFPEARSVEFLRSAGPGNRPLAFPYAKWHSSQWAVDQAAALLVCSAESARELGIPTERWVFPRVALESSHSLSLTKRKNMHRWEAMGVLGEAAEDHLGFPLTEVDYTELYSCFPSAVQVQQRELRLDLNAVPTITGGMAFAGGPFNNFTYQTTAAMAALLREDQRSCALVTTVSGLLTKPALAVWSGTPGPVLVEDLGDRAAGVTPTKEVVESATLTHDDTRDAEIASLTVTYSGDEASSAFVIADLADGRRWIGTSDDADLLDAAQRVEMIGQPIHIDGTTCRI